MLQTTKCSPSGILVHAVLWYCFTHSYKHIAYMDARKKYHKTACASLPEDEHLVVRNMSKPL